MSLFMFYKIAFCFSNDGVITFDGNLSKCVVSISCSTYRLIYVTIKTVYVIVIVIVAVIIVIVIVIV